MSASQCPLDMVEYHFIDEFTVCILNIMFEKFHVLTQSRPSTKA